MTEPSIADLCTELISWAHDRLEGPGESPVFRFERWITEDPERGWAVLEQLVERAPRDGEVMSVAAIRVPQLLYRDFRHYRERVLALLRASSYLDALLGPEVFIEEDYAPREFEPEHLAQVWLRNSRATDRAEWPETLNHEDPEVRLRIALEIVERGPLKGFDSSDVDGPLLEVLRHFGERVIDAIEAAAQRSAAVRLAIWSGRHLNYGLDLGNGPTPRVPAEVWARFQAAAGETNQCNTRLPAGQFHKLAPLEEQVVEAWFARKSSFWASSELDDLVRNWPERGWETILAIVRGSESGGEREYCGAGPLEDLIRENPELFIARAEVLALRDSRFREALAGIWISLEDVPEPLARRYFIASGRQMRILDAPEGWNPHDGVSRDEA